MTKKLTNKFNVFQVVAIFWLLFCVGFFTGIILYATETWPYSTVEEIRAFFTGGDRELSVKKMVSNDLNFKPSRHISDTDNMKFSDYKKQAAYEYKEIKNLPLNPRRENPRMFLSEEAPKGYRLIFGSFDFEDKIHGAILINPDGSIKNIWKITQEDVSWNHRKDANVFPHGMEITENGSIITAYDGGTSLTKYDYCGNILWRIKGGFHHSVNLDGEGALWTWGIVGKSNTYGNYLIKIDVETGKVLKEIHIKEMIEANPEIDIFSLQQKDTAKESKWWQNPKKRWHANDADPLTSEYADYFDDFKKGDILISFRVSDLIFVLDPETLKVKWWRIGITRRQHDPDWTKDGTIIVFNNNMHKDFSSIVEVNPSTYKHKTILDGRNYGFYTWMRGKHQKLQNGSLLITSSQQGRVFEVDKKGNITFEFLNVYGSKDKDITLSYGQETENLVISEARFIPLDFFSEEVPRCR